MSNAQLDAKRKKASFRARRIRLAEAQATLIRARRLINDALNEIVLLKEEEER